LTGSGATWPDGNIKKFNASVGVTTSASLVYFLAITDETATGYTGGNVYNAIGLNYSVPDARPA
jgi:hypothetical protein